MAWFYFSQNNSGGSFSIDDAAGIGPEVWVEAEDVASANDRAETFGVYFDGCYDDTDCPCCGDRWSAVDEHDRDDCPVVYSKYAFDWHDTVYAHALDGTIHRLTADNLDAAPLTIDVRYDD